MTEQTIRTQMLLGEVALARRIRQVVGEAAYRRP